MELQIEGQHIDVHDDLRSLITSRLEKLNARHGDIIHARVSLVKSSHHQHGSDEVHIFLSMNRRKVLQATKVGKTLEEAVSSTLDALSRELTDYRCRRRELDKRRLKTAKVGPRMSGKVVETVPAQGYGFIDIGVAEDIRFSRQVVLGDSFESIAVGDSVEVDVVETPQGYEVTRVVSL
ncbi:MAG TPA: HPF/RaiA family ribosome-associated protein [Candidatus Tectomicrobia bacterium]|jgi:ribosomal subunit interface protein